MPWQPHKFQLFLFTLSFTLPLLPLPFEIIFSAQFNMTDMFTYNISHFESSLLTRNTDGTREFYYHAFFSYSFLISKLNFLSAICSKYTTYYQLYIWYKFYNGGHFLYQHLYYRLIKHEVMIHTVFTIYQKHCVWVFFLLVYKFV